jgi:hypothetical protein
LYTGKRLPRSRIIHDLERGDGALTALFAL